MKIAGPACRGTIDMVSVAVQPSRESADDPRSEKTRTERRASAGLARRAQSLPRQRKQARLNANERKLPRKTQIGQRLARAGGGSAPGRPRRAAPVRRPQSHLRILRHLRAFALGLDLSPAAQCHGSTPHEPNDKAPSHRSDPAAGDHAARRDLPGTASVHFQPWRCGCGGGITPC
jgi:hypothetical protein